MDRQVQKHRRLITDARVVGVPLTLPRTNPLREGAVRKLGLVALTQSERNKRYYNNHKKEALERNAQFYRDNKETQAARHRNTRHHITQEWFDNKLIEQDNKCAICRKSFIDTPHIDHCHDCCPQLKSCKNCRRDLLCKDCNLGLGRFHDDPVILGRAIDYVAKHKGIKQ